MPSRELNFSIRIDPWALLAMRVALGAATAQLGFMRTDLLVRQLGRLESTRPQLNLGRVSHDPTKVVRAHVDWFKRNNPIMVRGQMALSVSAWSPASLKIGDGVTPWSDLPFITTSEPQ